MTALGVALLVLGTTAVLLEAHFPALGMLGVPGVVGLVIGSVLTVAGLGGGIVAAVIVAVLVAAAGAALVAASVRKGAAVTRRRVRAGAEGIIGHIGTVRSWSGESGDGKVLVDGALWQARQSLLLEDHPDALRTGDKVVVEQLRGLTVGVRRAEEWELV
jgi:membrane-bound serine protease (ClpP class)